jgi:hypothetical protein
MNQKNNSICNNLKESKIGRYKFNLWGKRSLKWKQSDTEKRNWRNQNMERPAELILWKWLYYWKWAADSCNPKDIQNSNDILYRNREKQSKNNMEAQKTLNSQSNPEQTEQCWKYHSTWLQIILQSHNTHNSMVLAEKQINKPVG